MNKKEEGKNFLSKDSEYNKFKKRLYDFLDEVSLENIFKEIEKDKNKK